MITDVLFDFFGTLVEYRPTKFIDPDERQAYDYLCLHGYRSDVDAFIRAFGNAFLRFECEAQRTLREPHMLDIARAFLHEAPGVDVDDELVLGFVERFIDQWNTSTRSIDGVDALLSGISQRYRLSIISNTFYPPLVVGNLERMGLRGYFADVVMSAEHGSRKPDPSIFRDTLARLGSSAADAVYVGDSYEADYEGGLAAGLRAILVDPERRRPELGPNRVGHILELADLLSDRH